MKKKVESTADFKARLAARLGVSGVRHAPALLVRQPGDRGYDPPKVKERKITMKKTMEEEMCETATGCNNAGGYRRYAEEQGYPHCAVLDWTSSAGDWSLLVSKDGVEWLGMSQTNNYPRAGFTRTIDEGGPRFYGSEEQALQQAYDYWNPVNQGA